MNPIRWPRQKPLTLLTWNVWFGLERTARRWGALLAATKQLRPDVIAFQEVTAPFLELLHKQRWLARGYTLSDPEGAEIDGYGNVIATRSSPTRTATEALPSEMGRKLVIVEAPFAGRSWAFGCVHLESYRESADARGRQLKRVFERMDGYDDAVLMGDFNFCASWTEENERIPAPWIDAWDVVGREPGWTVDTDVNEMRYRHAGTEKRVRIDRVLVRSDRSRPVRADLVGTRPIRDEAPPIWPSDHFGVVVELRLDA